MGDIVNKNVKMTGATPVERYGVLSVKGNQLVDRNGNAVALRGVSTHGLSWYPQYVNQESFRFMRDEWGIEVVRLAVYTAEHNGYCVGDDDNRRMLKDVIHKGVLAAADLGLYVIIDWHILSDGNPNQNKEQSLAFFKESSKRYREYDNVIYEICNEPNGNVGWPEIKGYADEVIPVIRQNDEAAIILVGTPTWSQEVDKAQADPITGYNNLMYVLHFYADTHREELRSKLKQAHDGGLPIFVSEFGICDASGSGAVNAEEAGKWIELLESRNISYIAWNLSNKEETAAFFKSSCTKTTYFDNNDLSESAKWFIQTK